MKKQNKNYSSSSKRSASRSLESSSQQSSDKNSSSFQRIYDVVRKIPVGKVMTYGQVALLANVATPRVVGFALHVNNDPQHIPCHRVIFASGKLTPGYAFGGEEKQRAKLKSEGVVFTIKNTVDLEKSKVS